MSGNIIICQINIFNSKFFNSFFVNKWMTLKFTLWSRSFCEVIKGKPEVLYPHLVQELLKFLSVSKGSGFKGLRSTWGMCLYSALWWEAVLFFLLENEQTRVWGEIQYRLVWKYITEVWHKSPLILVLGCQSEVPLDKKSIPCFRSVDICRLPPCLLGRN